MAERLRGIVAQCHLCRVDEDDIRTRREAGRAVAACGRCDTVVGVDRLRALRHPRIRQCEREGDRASRRADVEHVVIELARIARGQLVAGHTLRVLRKQEPELRARAGAIAARRQGAEHRIRDQTAGCAVDGLCAG